MKFHYLSLALAACLSTAAAQGLDSLPSCAKGCATDAIPDHCGMIDVGCICSDKSFISSISCCVSSKCSDDDQKSRLVPAVIQFANQICSGAGVKDLPKSASCASGASSATESSSEASTGSASSTATGQSSDASTTGASKASATSGSSSSSETASSTGTSTGTAESAATSTAGAALVQGKDTSLLAAAGAALFAFLA
ncbi:hypothetical protein P170DRAFT_428217 [Aspergillus steynii IBT 23096]|uniref:CFEM domain-containing protein n=1 Tax=Aspergillus steynii IBT 23096 TaxID=1392250 RepID=A0A2I2G270_9EURO|nr:uncharacterized protein P170DRAFT_428217 [Aspergillus steynii IBT 23096]PLB46965.1 hypothetical protein P170DRAFT_428217 [Aspergillus steynii IBT 23096]